MNNVEQGQSLRVNGESVIVAIFLCLSIYYLYETFNFRATLMEDVIGPSSFPRVIAVMSIGLCLLYFARRHIFRASEPEVPTEAFGTWTVELMGLVPIIQLLAYVLLLEPLGFPVATVLYILSAMIYLGRSVLQSVLYAVFLMVLFFSLFYFGLKVELPMGRWIATEQLLPFLLPLRDAIGG